MATASESSMFQQMINKVAPSRTPSLGTVADLLTRYVMQARKDRDDFAALSSMNLELLRTATADLQRKKELIDNLRVSRRTLYTKLRDTEALKRRSGELIRQRQCTIDELNAKVGELSYSIDELNVVVSELKVELDSTYATLTSEADAAQRKLQLELRAKGEEQDRLLARLDERDLQIAELNKKCDNLTQRVRYKDQKIASLCQYYIDLQGLHEVHVSQHAQKVQDLEAQIESWSKQERERLGHVIPVQDREVVAKDDEIAKLKDQLRRLRIDCDTENAKAEDWQDCANDRLKRIKELEDQAYDWQNFAKEQQVRIRELEDPAKRFDSEVTISADVATETQGRDLAD